MCFEFDNLVGEQLSIRRLTWQQMSLLENRTIIRYLGVLYLFLSCTTSRFLAKKSVFPSVEEKSPSGYTWIRPTGSAGLMAHAHSAVGDNELAIVIPSYLVFF